MKSWVQIICLLVLTACAAARPRESTFNEKLLEEQRTRRAAGEDIYGDNEVRTSNVTDSSLWAKSMGSPYIIRNQKASKVGDLLTIVINESSSASSEANTETTKETDVQLAGTLAAGQATAEQLATISGSTGLTNDFKGEGKTDRTGTLSATVQAVVEEVLPNGTLFIRGRKVITVNNEDQEVELTGFVRPDDIRINNTVTSTVLADAKIRYLGNGVIGDKQRVGWGSRLLDFVWPF